MNDSSEQESIYRKQLQAFSKLKATLQILQLIQKRFEAKMEGGSQDEKEKEKTEMKHEKEHGHSMSRTKSQIRANAILLRKCLLNVIGSGKNI